MYFPSPKDGYTIMSRYAYTLIELLVAIVIIMILMGVIFAIFSESRNRSYQVTCLSNIHQANTALRMYVQEYEAYPTINTWESLTSTPSFQQLPLCPALRHETTATLPRSQFRGIPGYALNTTMTFNGVGSGDALPESNVPFPTTTVLLCEAAEPVEFTLAPDPCSMVSPCRYRGMQEGFKRHSGGANYTFADGHAKWYRPEQVISTNGIHYNMNYHNDGTQPTFSRN